MKLTSIYRKISLSFLFSCLFFVSSYGQITIADTNVCVSHHLGASLSGVTPMASGITVDDGWSPGVFPLNGGSGTPFNFTYFGTNYTSCIIGGNGLIGFNTSLAGAYQSWVISAPLLGNASVLNSICGPWADICLPCNLAMGSITYSTSGVAPNRRFCATWCSAPMFSCTTQWTTSQIILYETTNIIEVHIRNKTVCAWNGGYAIVGVQNATGSVAVAAPGRDYPSVWSVTATPEAWRFTPSGGSYTVSSIAYNPLPFNSPTVYWYDSTTNAYLGSGPITVTPTVTTTYKAAFIACKDTVIDYITLAPVTVPGGEPTLDSVTHVDPSECGVCDGRLTLRGVRQHQVDTVHYLDPSGILHTFVDSATAAGTITINGLCPGIYKNIYITVGNCPTPAYDDTLTSYTIGVSHVTFTNPTVCGKNDGTVTLWGLTPGKADTVTYTDGLGSHSVTGMVAPDSSITLSGLVGYSSGTSTTNTYNFNIKVRYCSTTATATLTDPAPYAPSFDTTVTLGCEGDRIDFVNTTVPAGYYSFWTYGDGSPMETTTSPFHIFHTETGTPKYTGNYVITLAYNTTASRLAHCEMSETKVFAPDHQIHAVFNAGGIDTVCLGIPFNFTNYSTTHYSPTYLWTYQGGVEETTTDSATGTSHTYPIGGQYRPKLTVTDAIGCVDVDSMTVEVVSINVKAGFGVLNYLLPNADTSVCLFHDSLAGVHDSIYLHAYDSVVYSQKGNEGYHTDWTWAPSSSNPAFGGIGNLNTQFPRFTGLGDYVYTVTATTNTFHCSESQEVIIHSFPPLVLTDLTPTGQIVTQGNTLQLHAAGAAYYWWTPDDGSLNDPNVNNPIATPHDTVTVYTVHGMSIFGCPAQADIVVYVDNNTDEFVPSAFTPNGDGLNDLFRPMKLRFQKLVDFRIFNRYGQQLYQTITPGAGWDGTFKGVPQDMGTYHYTITIQRPDGKEKVMNGTFNLIR